MLTPSRPSVAVFASDKGPGDAERASIMSQTGTYLARKGARIVCLAEDEGLAVPLVTSARAAGGDVLVIGDEDFVMPAALAGVPLERIADPERRLARVAELAQVLVGLPGSLASASRLFSCWVKAGGGQGGRGVVLFNRNRAFEAMRGMATDVLSHGIRRHDRFVQFADTVEDLWTKVQWLITEAPKV
jgi:predicted Rossmann-fold nucleotide-binding protein